MSSRLDQARQRVQATAGALRLTVGSGQTTLRLRGAVSVWEWALADALGDSLADALAELERAEREAGLR